MCFLNLDWMLPVRFLRLRKTRNHGSKCRRIQCLHRALSGNKAASVTLNTHIHLRPKSTMCDTTRSSFKTVPEVAGIIYRNCYCELRNAYWHPSSNEGRCQKETPIKWRTNSLFLLQDNAPAHRSVLVQDFLAKNNLRTLEHPPYSPDLATTNFYL
jgi:hypothetical protein